MPASGILRKPFTSMCSAVQFQKNNVNFVFCLMGNQPKVYLISGVHRLSLKYHPDKNKDKGAQQKFEEINNGKTHTTMSI
jgi:hypothetical protein